MSSTLNDTMGAAKDVVESAKEGTEHAVSSARSTLLDGVKAIGGIIAMLKSFQLDDGLGWVGLERRRTPFYSAAIFGMGVAVGAGVGMLFAPKSGVELRRMILDQLKAFGAEAQAEVKDVEEKAEDLAGKAKDAVKKAERKVEGKVEAAASAVKETVKDTVSDAKSALHTATDTTEANKPARPMSGVGNGPRPS
jgi:gas vesicle protein